ncbi:Glycosyltransferase family 4 protein [Rhodovastum atsumiense]|uniref:Glycosyltransferase family 4 protein n=1 Tax=Rhodovastum atsumiense TaxID=504468 RepID=A0A5M6J3Z7_9PROT|nr:glycosyltransferase [Rhodovastum atsumiense]KAA5614338.1 glycosyltransferase family 4 protein [Rhodovastum atsumiense]CAH2604807.1 Glycosyltransferase family 4 protein [Rhodovastum atsumiense]
MRVLVWHWGRRGAGPRFAAELAATMRDLPGHEALLSLSAQAELLAGPAAPVCELPFPTYSGLFSLLRRLPAVPFDVPGLAARIQALDPDIAICGMPAVLDLAMAAALRRAGVPFLVVVHDADVHPGDGVPLQMWLQRALVRRADGLIALTGHVAQRLREQGLVAGKPLLMASLPPFAFGPPPPPPRAHGGRLRLLSFGRLLPYKGLDLLAAALTRLGPRPDVELRVVGSGPESEALDTLRHLPGVAVENRWVPEQEVGHLLAWSDALVLSHTEASQSGVAAAAVAARRWVVATNVGGIREQLGNEPLARLCEPTPDSLAAALAGLIEDPPRSLPASGDPSGDPGAAWHATTASVMDQIAGAFARR